jgi:uncharacterized protein YacL
MKNWIPLSIVALMFSSLRVMSIINSSAGALLLSRNVQNQLGNLFYYINSSLHFSVILMLAACLNIIKESIWCSIAYIVYALMSLTFIVMSTIHTNNPKVWGIIGAINLFSIIFITVQSFLVKNTHFKGSFKWYSIVLLLMAFISMGIPYAASLLALPISYIEFTSIIYIIPAIFEIYLAYLFYQYFNRPAVDSHTTL